MSMPVEELTRRIASGDPEAFAGLYRQRFDRMYASARRFCGQDEAFCLDVVQDAMMRAMRRMRVLDSEARLDAWLDRLVRCCAVDRIRAEVRRRRREQAAAGPRGEQAAPPARDLAALEAGLARLAPEQQRLITERYRFGWTLERIGRALGLGPGAVDGRLRRAVAALRRAAREEAHEP